MIEPPFVELRSLTKAFNGVTVLRDVTMGFRRGEVHALLGENGAGKSTLIKILTGVYSQTSGEVLVDGAPVHIGTPLDARRFGLGAVYQDVELVSRFTVAENIILGREPGRFALGRRAIRKAAVAVLADIGFDLDPDRRTTSLSPAEAQIVAIAQLLHGQYKLIVLDEPTARLSAESAEMLFRVIARLQAAGIGFIYISHRLNEVKRLCSRATILRGGVIAAELTADRISESEVTRHMLNRSHEGSVVANPGLARGGEVFAVEGLATDRLQPMTFALRAGEVLGVTGPVGGGMDEIARALAGVTPHRGAVRLKGRPVTIRSPSQAVSLGIALVPEDRRRQGLFPNLSVAENLVLPTLSDFSTLGVVVERAKQAFARLVMDKINIRPRQPNTRVTLLSGGNQQKAVIGKWFGARATIYILAEPTAGVDVGAIREIYQTVLSLAREGAAVLVISSSVREVLALAERVMIIHDGRLVHEAARQDCTEDQVLAISMTGRAGAGEGAQAPAVL